MMEHATKLEVKNMGNITNIEGATFGRLSVIERVENTKAGKVRWKCLCLCGRFSVVIGAKLSGGWTKSCGCLQKEMARKANKTHGKAKSREYSSWSGMIQRCTNNKRKAYPRYGGRGIKVCAEWLNSFESFFEDMGERPKGRTLDRIDNEGDYEASNCKWSTAREQKLNQRPCKHYREAVAYSPCGDKYSIKKGGVSKFARENNLHKSALLRVLDGRVRATGGWTGSYIGNET